MYALRDFFKKNCFLYIKNLGNIIRILSFNKVCDGMFRLILEYIQFLVSIYHNSQYMTLANIFNYSLQTGQ